jgi:hypothetical protein
LELKDKEVTIDEAYKNDAYQEIISFDALKLYGFYIKKSDAFIEEVVYNNYQKPGFLPDFLKYFPENIIFSSEYHNLEYFNELFTTIENNVDALEFGSETVRNISEIIYLISQLDVFDADFEFRDVFNIVSSSRLMHMRPNPEYITQILSKLVLADKKEITSVYDPFMKDASSIMKIYESNKKEPSSALPQGVRQPAMVNPYTNPTGERITQPPTKVSDLYPEYYSKPAAPVSTTQSDFHNSAYVEMLDWANDESWEIQELNGKYYRVLQDGAFEELGVDEEYEYEEEIGDIEDLYQYAQDNKSRVVKAIRKR